MMLAFADGDLVSAIDAKIRGSEKVQHCFLALFDLEDKQSDSERLDIMNHILERYIKMCGCWFTKHVKKNQRKSLGEIKVAAAPTRMMVAHKHAQAKEKALWEGAGHNVVEYKDEEDLNENNDGLSKEDEEMDNNNDEY